MDMKSISKVEGYSDECMVLEVHCVDQNNDGRFGVALYEPTEGRLLKPNYGHFYACTSFKSKISDCT
jgi:hypothetical protein